MSENWKNLAEKSGTSIWKIVIDYVDNSLKLAEENYRSRSLVLEENPTA